MFNISNYLSKFKSVLVSNKISKDVVSSIIKDVSRVTVDPKNVTIKSGVVYIKASPAVKSTLFVHKELILKKIKETSDNKLFDIK